MYNVTIMKKHSVIRKTVLISIVVVVMLTFIALLYAENADGTFASPSFPLAEFVASGPFAVETRRVFFHDPERPFDAWNATHASTQYQELLAEISATGERKIVPARIWYPDTTASSSENSKSDAGPFPVIIASHGLGGNSHMWASFADYLASRGYIVVALDYLTDSSLPHAFSSPDSLYAQSVSSVKISQTYRMFTGEQKVVNNFFRYLFGITDLELAFELFQKQVSEEIRESAQPGGVQRVGEMMAGFFTQRLDDIETVISGLISLNKDTITCKAEYTKRGQPLHGEEMCGRLSGALELTTMGAIGHSLGSMTSLMAAERIDNLKAAVGYNNGPPHYWEPQGIFGEGLADDGQPRSSSMPIMIIHGSEDAFVQTIFRVIMWNTYVAAGGDPADIWQLEGERLLPTEENPQPVARNFYNRAVGDKAIVLVRDLNHDALVSDFLAKSARFSGVIRKFTSNRKAVGQDVLNPNFVGRPFKHIGWEKLNGHDVFLPVFIRNYYTRLWFDYYLKGDPEGLRFKENPISELRKIEVRMEISNSQQ